MAKFGPPGAELAVDVIRIEPDESRDPGLHAGQRLAMARDAGRDAARRNAVLDDILAARQHFLRRRHLDRRWIRRRQLRVVRRDLAQVLVGQMARHVHHLRIRALAVAEVHELPVQVLDGLAGDARVILVLPAALALLAVAPGAGEHALLHRVGKVDPGGGIGCCAVRARHPRSKPSRQRARKSGPRHGSTSSLLLSCTGILTLSDARFE